MWFKRNKKNRSTLTTYLRDRIEIHRLHRITTVAVTQHLFSEMTWVLFLGKNSSAFGTVYCPTQCPTVTTQCPMPTCHNPMPNCPNSYASLHARRTDIQIGYVGWYRTVHVLLLVVSYDTHKGNRWTNFNPPNHRGKSNIQVTLLTSIYRQSLLHSQATTGPLHSRRQALAGNVSLLLCPLSQGVGQWTLRLHYHSSSLGKISHAPHQPDFQMIRICSRTKPYLYSEHSHIRFCIPNITISICCDSFDGSGNSLPGNLKPIREIFFISTEIFYWDEIYVLEAPFFQI